MERIDTDFRIDKSPAGEPPGSILVAWPGIFNENVLVLRGNEADDFLERFSGAADDDARLEVFVKALAGTETI